MKFALTVSGEGLVLVLPSASLYHAYLQVRSMNLKEGRYMLTNNERNDEKVGILVNSNGATPLILLNTPETVQVDENETIKCLRFRQFCNSMQYPEPTLVEMSAETEALLTLLINDGLVSCWEAYKACVVCYSFNEDGREVVRTKEPCVLIPSLNTAAAEAAKQYMGEENMKSPATID